MSDKPDITTVKVKSDDIVIVKLSIHASCDDLKKLSRKLTKTFPDNRWIIFTGDTVVSVENEEEYLKESLEHAEKALREFHAR